MNTDRNNWRHLQLTEDFEWSAKILSYKNEIRDMLAFLEDLSGQYCDEAMLIQISATCDQLTTQMSNLDEIAHIARSNEFALIAKLHLLDAEAANRYKTASHIKERSLLQFFVCQFEKVREEYARLYNTLNVQHSYSA
jgi:hypothetical protein